MSQDSDLDAFATAAAATLNLPTRPEWRAAIRANLATTLRFADLVGAFPLPDDAEPAPIFRL